MLYYNVWVNNSRNRGNEPLTYSANEKYAKGSIVLVPFGKSLSVGLVDKEVARPTFKTKPIEKKLIDSILPPSAFKLFSWLQTYYPAPSSAHLQLFLPALLQKVDKTKNLESVQKLPQLELPPLTDEQKKVLGEIKSSDSRSILIHGETGTGKTRVYTELIKDVISNSKSAIVLIPEIGLTPQIIKVLEQSFAGQVISIHSGLTDKAKRENWLKIISSREPIIVVGPRSALFAPLKDVGLIVIDEAHETSYKQEQLPYYQTTRVAAKLTEIANARIVLGTATPLVSDYYVFQIKNLEIIRMTEQAVPSKYSGKANIKIIELTDRTKFNKSRWLSDELIESVRLSLSENQQSLIFINRRGTAPTILCQNCGWQAFCPNCDTSLTYHSDKHSMECHSCSYSSQIPSLCPVCKSTDIIFRGAGTKAITEEVKKLFPAANVSRFDRDNKKHESLQENFHKLQSGQIDIAVGTQIITKGLDLSKLSTVGIVIADSGLSFPDYTAEEKTYENISQVIGRVSRGHIPGRVIVQTYHPDSPAIKSAVNQDYESFYKLQISERQKFDFPPFVYLLKLSCKKSSSSKAKSDCENLIETIRDMALPLVINGPAPAFHEKINGKFVWQIIIKSRNRTNLIKIIDILPSNWTYDLDPSTLL